MNFQDSDFTPTQATHKIRVALEGNTRNLKTKKFKNLLMPSIDKEKPWSFFDEAC
jgi:hypothetical protein